MKWDGLRLQYLRKKKGLTQKQLANQLNKAKSTISGYEINNSEPDTDTLVEMASLLETTTDYLLGIADEPNIKIYHYNELPDILKDAGLEELGLLKNYSLEDLTLEELESLVEISKKIKQRQEKSKNRLD